ncbi:hypothetical protein BJ165DRAFT_1593434 [Panaeolus papilionaceus]|nr:hypothetical protein BJ165DRAFT_1593434 [Panaeolus papilionaceus]
MIIDPEQLTPSGSQGERSPLKTSPPLPGTSNHSNYDPNLQPPPPYVPSSGSGSHNAIVHPYTPHPMNINFNAPPNPNPKPFKRFFKAFLVAILCLILWGIFVDTVGLMVKVEVGTRDDKRMQGLTPVERYMSMGPGGGIRRLYFSLTISNPIPTVILLGFSSDERPFRDSESLGTQAEHDAIVITNLNWSSFQSTTINEDTLNSVAILNLFSMAIAQSLHASSRVLKTCLSYNLNYSLLISPFLRQDIAMLRLRENDSRELTLMCFAPIHTSVSMTKNILLRIQKWDAPREKLVELRRVKRARDYSTAVISS